MQLTRILATSVRTGLEPWSEYIWNYPGRRQAMTETDRGGVNEEQRPGRPGGTRVEDVRSYIESELHCECSSSLSDRNMRQVK